MHADLHGAGVVLRTVEYEDFVIADDGGGVEGMESFPVDGGMGDGVFEGAGVTGGDDGSGGGAGEGWELPSGLGC